MTHGAACYDIPQGMVAGSRPILFRASASFFFVSFGTMAGFWTQKFITSSGDLVEEKAFGTRYWKLPRPGQRGKAAKDLQDFQPSCSSINGKRFPVCFLVRAPKLAMHQDCR